MTAPALIGRSRPPRDLAPWLIPVVVALVVLALTTKQLSDALVVGIGIPFFLFLVKRPGVALIALIIFLPLELIGFSLLYHLGLPASILRPAGALKEVMALSILVAGVAEIRRSGRRLDRIDAALLAYVAVVTIYLVVPHLFSATAPTQWSTRLLAWRTDAGYPLLFFGARHAPLPSWVRDHYVKVLLVLGGVAGLLAVFQRLDAAGWSSFILNTAHVQYYEINVLGLAPDTVLNNLIYIYTINPLRVSSLFLSPFDLGDYMVLATAIAAVRICTRQRDPLSYAVIAVAVAAVFFSRSRSDGVAAVVILVLIALPLSRLPRGGRVRLIGVMALAAVLILPVLGGSRFVGGEGGSSSAKGHITEIEDGYRVLLYYPLGLGLGDQPDTATRFTATSKTVNANYISDNLIFQVGDELGFQALLPWLLMLILILWELKRRAATGDRFAAALGFGLLGIVIAGMYHQVFLTYPVPWTLWAGAGLALSVSRSPYEQPALASVDAAPAGVP